MALAGVNGPSRQRGLGGVLALLVGVLIAAVVVTVAIKSQLAPSAGKGKRAEAVDVDTAVQGAVTEGGATPGSAIERARGLEEELKRQQEDLDKRIDSAQTGAVK